MNRLKNNLEKIVKYNLLILVFIPLIVAFDFLYPYILPRSLFFRIIIEILFIITVILLFQNKLNKLPKSLLVYTSLLFILILPLVSIFSIDVNESFFGNFERMEGGFYYFHLLVYFVLLLIYFREKEDWKKVFYFILTSSIIIDLTAIVQKLGLRFDPNDVGRIGGTLGNAAYLSSTVITSSILLLFFFYINKSINLKVWTGITLILNLIVLFISATRGSLVGLFISLFLFLIISLFKKQFLNKKKKIIIFLLLIILILSSLSIFIFKNSKFVQNVEPLRRISSMSLNDETIKSRIIMWKYSFRAFKEKPIFGWGLEDYDVVFNKYFESKNVEEWTDRAHNQYLDILVSGGIIAFIFYITFIFSVFYAIWKLYKLKKIDFIIFQIFFFGFIAYLIQNLFIFDTINNLIFFYIFIALIIYLNSQEQNINSVKYEVKINKFFKIIIFIIVLAGVVIAANYTVIKPAYAAYLSRSALNVKTSDFDTAKALYEKALSIMPASMGQEETLRSMFNQIKNQLELEDVSNLDWAINVFDSRNNLKLKNNIDKAYLYNFKGIDDKSYIDKNITLVNSLIELSPLRRDIYYLLGQAYGAKNDKEESINNFLRAVSIKEDRISLWNLISIYIYFGDYEMVSEYGKIFLNKYDFIESFQYVELVPSFNLTGDNGILEDILEELIRRENKAQYYSDLAIVKLRLGKDQEASELAIKAINMDPGQMQYLKDIFIFE